MQLFALDICCLLFQGSGQHSRSRMMGVGAQPPLQLSVGSTVQRSSDSASSHDGGRGTGGAQPEEKTSYVSKPLACPCCSSGPAGASQSGCVCRCCRCGCGGGMAASEAAPPSCQPRGEEASSPVVGSGHPPPRQRAEPASVCTADRPANSPAGRDARALPPPLGHYVTMADVALKFGDWHSRPLPELFGHSPYRFDVDPATDTKDWTTTYRDTFKPNRPT
eukprot:GHVT01055788.1.p1 GENE.GHVT01055788.1~~GHVT01055788.1.p1  ORF type:complete len:221 (-),score=39.85 GHVT01055788.1:26-688(-)